jgi:hypothetical protein
LLARSSAHCRIGTISNGLIAMGLDVSEQIMNSNSLTIPAVGFGHKLVKT